MKKKPIVLIMALVLCLGLTACGGSKSNKILQLGDTMAGDDYKITVKRVTYGRNLDASPKSDGYIMEDGDFDKTFTGADGKQYDKSYVAKDGRAFVCIEYTLKYKGKSATSYQQAMILDFDNGTELKEHPYVNNDFSYKKDDRFEKAASLDLEPSRDDYLIRTVYDVPEEVMTDHDKPLKIICDIKIKGENRQIQYQVR